MVYPNKNVEESNAKAEQSSKIEEAKGSLKKNFNENKLMSSVLDNDKELIDDGKLISDAINNSLGSFSPELMFEKLSKNFSIAKQIFGEKLLRELTGYDSEYLSKNMAIPEFRKEISNKIKHRFESMKKKGLVDKEYSITETGLFLSSVVLLKEELDKFKAKGLTGNIFHKKRSFYGEPFDNEKYARQSYRNLDIRATIKTAIKRMHRTIDVSDFKAFSRNAKGKSYVVFGLDSSGSMKGNKIADCKKAGVALAHNAIERKDNVGIIVFGKDVSLAIKPTQDFSYILKSIAKIKASQQTNIANTIERAISMFPRTDATKHLVLITDAMPTFGENPKEKALSAASAARDNDITISIVGINLNKEGKEFAEKLVAIGNGKLYRTESSDNLDILILDDYYSL